MKKRSSTTVQLVLISSLLASCSKPTQEVQDAKQRVYMRADSTAQYTEVTQQYQRHHGGGMGNTLLWYMAFRHLGGGMGYNSPGIHRSSVVGTNTGKSSHISQRGGFGSTSRSNSFSTGS